MSQGAGNSAATTSKPRPNYRGFEWGKGQCCLRVAASPYWPNGLIKQLNPSLTQNCCINLSWTLFSLHKFGKRNLTARLLAFQIRYEIVALHWKKPFSPGSGWRVNSYFCWVGQNIQNLGELLVVCKKAVWQDTIAFQTSGRTVTEDFSD